MLKRRKPDSEVIVHSDQGSQYGSDDWQRFCRANNLAPSMSRRGNCWDTHPTARSLSLMVMGSTFELPYQQVQDIFADGTIQTE
ncbi:DDE-type integrase/transposase/recombinase [Lelliottia wanjuensis]